jgi:hypothetical protein
MNCQKAGDLLSAYIEGEVAGRPCADLEAHLSGCGDCREELETLRSALVLLAAPKTLVRPEGLLEEFKAMYLPEAETAAAPRWGFRVPVLPKIEWPSLSRLMLPMGSLAAAGAAAALIVALHGHSGTLVPPSAGLPVAPTRVAQNMAGANPVSPSTEQNPKSAAASATEKATAPPRAARAKAAKVPAGEAAGPRRHSGSLVALMPVPHRLVEHRDNRSVTARRLTRHASHRSHGPMLANAKGVKIELPVSDEALTAIVTRHRDAVRSDELQWQAVNDQGGAVMHKATAPVAEDGYAEASCKNLATGKVLRSEAISIPSEPTPAGPVEDRSSGSK